MRKISFLIGIVAVGTMVYSCKPEGCTDSKATNFDSEAKKDNGNCTYDTSYEVPLTYDFKRNGETSVSYSGQTDRMNMLSEMVSYLKTANTPGTVLDAQKLKDMYANENSPFSDVGLNSSTKQLKNKTADGDPAIQAIYEGLFDDIAAISAETKSGSFDGANGTAGIVKSGSKQYLFNDKGVEYTQYIEKGLMGAVFYNQIQLVYLREDKMNVDNTNLVEGKNYTKMEHHWDEAFGYFTDATDFPLSGTDRFWGKYCNARDEQLGSNSAIMSAYIKGRAAIANNDLTTRDAQIAVIRRELQKVTIATALSYLLEAKANLADDAIRNHVLSEAVPFMQAIAHSYNPAADQTTVASLVTQLGDNFYEVKTADIDAVIAALESMLVGLEA